jgi:ABC-type lipoprotein release transport system permease subunit
VVLSFQDLDNEITSGAFTITGIFKTASTPYDERNVFVRAEDLQNLLAERAIYHEIAIMLYHENVSDAVAADLNEEFAGIIAESWHELSPELRYITEAGGSLSVYIMAVIMLALAFGILNTMLMAIFERMRELGMLLAIGMSKLRLFLMIMLESVILTLTGAAAGLMIAYLTLQYLGDKGIDMTSMGGESMAEFGYDAIVYPIAYTNDYTATIFLVVITAILAAVYPAIKALRVSGKSGGVTFETLAIWNVQAAQGLQPATFRIDAGLNDGAGASANDTVNITGATLHPDGMAPRIVNLDEWAWRVIDALRQEALRNPTSGSKR